MQKRRNAFESAAWTRLMPNTNGNAKHSEAQTQTCAILKDSLLILLIWSYDLISWFQLLHSPPALSPSFQPMASKQATAIWWMRWCHSAVNQDMCFRWVFVEADIGSRFEEEAKAKKKKISETCKKDLETAGLLICFLKSLFFRSGVLYDSVDFFLCRAIRISPVCPGL